MQIKPLILVMLAISVASILVFYVIGGPQRVYVGLTPPLTAVVAGAAAYASPMLFVAGLVAIYFTAKRSYLVAAAAYFVWLVAVTGRVRRVVTWNFVIRAASGWLIYLALVFFVPGAMADKVGTTVHSIIAYNKTETKKIESESERRGGATNAVAKNKEPGVQIPKASPATTAQRRGFLYLATAGRSEEILRIVEGMSAANWIFGHGAGFTYLLKHWDGTVVENNANSHFSPLGLAYKYGAPFALLFYAWAARMLLFKQKDGSYEVFWRGVLFILLIQSAFAFNWFVEFLFPLALAALAVEPPAEKFVAYGKAEN